MLTMAILNGKNDNEIAISMTFIRKKLSTLPFMIMVIRMPTIKIMAINFQW